MKRVLLFFITCALLPQQTFAQLQLAGLYIDPEGTDTGKEWISIQNTGTGSIVLDGWLLDPSNLPDLELKGALDPGAHLYVHFRSTESGSGSHLFLDDNFSTSNISNSKGHVALFNTTTKNTESIVDYVGYGASEQPFSANASEKELWDPLTFLEVSENMYLVRTGSGSTGIGAWSSTTRDPSLPSIHPPIESPTSLEPTSEVIPTSVSEEVANTPPTPIITVQGSKQLSGTIPFAVNVTGEESTDPDGKNDIQSYLWDFGNGSTSDRSNPLSITYNQAGTYPITLTLTDSAGNIRSTHITITATQKEPPSTNTISKPKSSPSLPPASCAHTTPLTIRITELFPNPEGTDIDKEWIELHNHGAQPVNLCGLKVDDSEGGSTPYIFPSITLAPHSYHVLESSVSKIVLNNSKEEVRFFDSTHNILQRIVYENAPENRSFSLIGG